MVPGLQGWYKTGEAWSSCDGVAQGEECSHTSGARDLTRGTGKAILRGPGLEAYPGSHVTDDPQSRQYRGIAIGVFPVLGPVRTNVSYAANYDSAPHDVP